MRKVLLVGAVTAVAAVAVGCGDWFDYDAEEFKAASDSAKELENISDAEILSIINGIADRKLPAMSTTEAQAEVTAVATGIVPDILAPTGATSLLLADSKDPAEACELTKGMVDPCIAVNGAEDKRLTCRSEQALFYIAKAREMVCKAGAHMGNVNKALVLILGDKIVDVECGKVKKDNQPAAKFVALLPKRWQSVVLDYLIKVPESGKSDSSCVQSLASAEKRSFEILLRDNATQKSTSYLAVNPSAPTAEKNTIFPSFIDALGKDVSKYALTISGEDGKIPARSPETLATVQIVKANQGVFRATAEVTITNLECSAEFVGRPSQVKVSMYVNGDTYYVNVGTYSPRFSAAGCEVTPDASTSLVMYSRLTAKADSYQMAHYVYPETATLANINRPSDDNLLGKYCVLFPDRCTDGKAKIDSVWTEGHNYYRKDSKDAATRWSATEGVDEYVSFPFYTPAELIGLKAATVPTAL